MCFDQPKEKICTLARYGKYLRAVSSQYLLFPEIYNLTCRCMCDVVVFGDISSVFVYCNFGFPTMGTLKDDEVIESVRSRLLVVFFSAKNSLIVEAEHLTKCELSRGPEKPVCACLC